jgi:hypothetical protein
VPSFVPDPQRLPLNAIFLDAFITTTTTTTTIIIIIINK